MGEAQLMPLVPCGAKMIDEPTSILPANWATFDAPVAATTPGAELCEIVELSTSTVTPAFPEARPPALPETSDVFDVIVVLKRLPTPVFTSTPAADVAPSAVLPEIV